MSKLEAALALAARGFKVFPIAVGAKAPPLINDWPNKATSDEGTIRGWWGGIFPAEANIGIHCEGMIVVDVDVKKGGNDSLQLLETTYGFPGSLVHETPTGGKHVFYRSSQPVGNSVAALGVGLDIRSEGGYVVAPGSTVAAGDYRVQEDAGIADAPDWLVHKLGTFTPRERSEIVNVPDAKPGAVARARTWLETQPEAIEGQGGDARTFTVACGLRDLGVSAQQALYLLLNHWNERCSPPWLPNELGIKVDNAYRYAQNEPGGAVAKAEDFPLIQLEPQSWIKRSAVSRLVQFANSEARGPGYLVKGLLVRRTYAEAYGAPGEGKTFVALDIAYAVAADLPWMGRKVHSGPVLYLAYEGAGGLVKRAQALRKKYGDKDVPLYIATAAFNIREKEGRTELGKLIAELPEKPVLVAFDTFARALMGGDENSAQDVGAFNGAVAALIESTGACVMIIHHSGKNKSAGARGSSALQGAIDTEIEVDGGKVTATKQRDMETGEPIGFKLVPTIVGLDEDGDEVTSCIVEPDAVSAGPSGRLSGNAKRGFDVLCELSPGNQPVSEMAWRDACAQFLGNKSLSQRFYDIKKTLRAKGYVLIDGQGNVTRRIE